MNSKKCIFEDEFQYKSKLFYKQAVKLTIFSFKVSENVIQLRKCSKGKRKMSKRNNSNIDKTSIIMTALFFAIIIVGLVAVIVVATNTFDENKNVVDAQDVDLQDLLNKEENEKEEESVKYESIQALSDAFMDICKRGDADAMYALYYDNLLEKRVEEMCTDEESRKMYDANFASEMATVADFDEFEYGSTDLPPTMTAYQYVYTFYSSATDGGELPVTEDRIDNCADLRVYREDGTYRDHMMARIDGYWYLVV